MSKKNFYLELYPRIISYLEHFKMHALEEKDGTICAFCFNEFGRYVTRIKYASKFGFVKALVEPRCEQMFKYQHVETGSPFCLFGEQLQHDMSKEEISLKLAVCGF